MILELSEQQRQAVERGDPVRLAAEGLGDVIVFRAQAFDERDASEQEQKNLAMRARQAAKRWGRENPFDL